MLVRNCSSNKSTIIALKTAKGLAQSETISSSSLSSLESQFNYC